MTPSAHQPKLLHLVFRGYANGKLIFEERADLEGGDDAQVEQLAAAHAERLQAYDLHLLEIEDLDEPDPLQRFFRMGTDPRGMANPVAVELPLRRAD
jgi:hypothetical protein